MVDAAVFVGVVVVIDIIIVIITLTANPYSLLLIMVLGPTYNNNAAHSHLCRILLLHVQYNDLNGHITYLAHAFRGYIHKIQYKDNCTNDKIIDLPIFTVNDIIIIMPFICLLNCVHTMIQYRVFLHRGVVLFVMVNGSLPFDGSYTKRVLLKRMSLQIFDFASSVSLGGHSVQRNSTLALCGCRCYVDKCSIVSIIVLLLMIPQTKSLI